MLSARRLPPLHNVELLAQQISGRMWATLSH